MKEIKVYKKNKFNAEIEVVPDKSITHRAVMLASISCGCSEIQNFSESKDCWSTINAFKNLGVKIEKNKNVLTVYGIGMYGLQQPTKEIDAGNSGTTVRLLSGILAGNEIEVTIVGDESLSKRPMKRIIEPLSLMGAKITAKQENFLPLKILGTKQLKPLTWISELSSAQVKSCILFAGMYANGETVYQEPVKSRDHTERMMKLLNLPIEVYDRRIVIKGKVNKIEPFKIKIPGDISAASYFIAMCLLSKDSNVIIRDVCINPTRMGFVNTLLKMGAQINITNYRIEYNEPVGDIIVKSSKLRSIKIEPEDVPSMIDELPLLAVIATQCDGVTEITGAKELRVKETDRIKAITLELQKMDAKIIERPDGMIIMGNTKLKPAIVDSYGDHRIAMSLAVAGSIIDAETIIKNSDCVDISFPGFWELYNSI